MSYRQSTSIVLATIAAIPVALGGCPSDPAKSSCVIETYDVKVANKALPAKDSLFLLPDARLDAVGDGFVLMGSDATTVRWAVLDTKGVVAGDEQFIKIPDHSAGPWFAVAGTGAPRDHVLIAYVPLAAPASGDVDLMTISVQIDGTNPGLETSSGKIAAGSKVAMMSGRAGMNAGVAWARQGQTDITARFLGGDGVPIGADVVVGSVGDFDCLRFSPGKGDLTLGYVDLSGTPPVPHFVGAEFDTKGAMQPTFRLNIGKQLPGCVELVSAADKTYGVAWHSSGIGTYFSPYDPASTQLSSVLILPDDRVHGEPPTLGGIGWLGKNYALVFAKGAGAEIWPIDANGHGQGTLPALPSSVGHTGKLSTQPVGSALYATYADYTYADPTNTSAGSRLLVKVSCPNGP